MTLSVLFFLPLMAQDEQTLTLSLERAQQYAVEHNRTLMNASLSVKQAEAARWQTIATMLPQVSASFDYQDYCGYSMNFGGMGMAMNPSGSFTLTAAMALSGTQIVGSLIHNLSIEMQEVSKLKTEQDIKTQTASVYMSILAMEQTLGLLNQNLDNLRRLATITENSVKVGVSEQVDADQIQVQVSSMQSSINSSARMVEMLYNSMRLQLGVSVNTNLVLTEQIDQLLNIEQALSLLKQDFNLNKNYDYQLVNQNTELSKKQITLAAMDYVPSVSAFYQYSARTYFGKDEGFNMTPPNLVGVSLSVPIWSSGTRAAKITETKLAHQAAQNTLADTKDALLVQERQLKYNLASAYESYETQKANIDVSQRVFQNISNKYEHGMTSSLEVTNASTSLITAQSNYINALLELVNAQIELRKLLNL